jgi:membrane-bound metal-dependent hydrolase YbcI (DUF457 family)
MDNLTHTLFAITLGRTPLARAGRGVTPTLILASNAPDIDFVSAAGGALSYLHWHRGPTHGPLGVIGLGLVTAGLVWTARRLFTRSEAGERASFPALAAIGMVGVLLHILMDLPTQYGTRIFSPLDVQWYAVNWMPIVDVYLLTVLAGGLAIGSIAARRSASVSRTRNARSWSAGIVLLFMLGNYGLRASSHEAALASAPEAFGATLPPTCPDAPSRRAVDRWSRETAHGRRSHVAPSCLLELVALPTFVSPFEWRLVARLSNAYEARTINILREAARASSGIQRYPDEWTPAVVSAADSEPGLTFLGFARFPAARSVPAPDGTTIVQWTDVRFLNDADDGDSRSVSVRRRDLFTVTVRVAPDGRVVESN